MAELEYVKGDTNLLAGMKEELNTYIAQMVSASESMYLTYGGLKEHFQGAPADAFYTAFASDLMELSRTIEQVKQLWQYEANALESYETCERVVSGIVGEL